MKAGDLCEVQSMDGEFAAGGYKKGDRVKIIMKSPNSGRWAVTGKAGIAFFWQKNLRKLRRKMLKVFHGLCVYGVAGLGIFSAVEQRNPGYFLICINLILVESFYLAK